MRLTIFVTVLSQLVTFSAFAQFGLNGQIPTQSGFTRTQLERAVSPPNTATAANPSGNASIYSNVASSASCLKTACKMSGEFGCDEQSEIANISRVCRGQVSDECLVANCAQLGEFACDEAREITKILVSNCGADEILRPSEQRVQDSGDRQTPTGF
jgi:hypothetical protein